MQVSFGSFSKKRNSTKRPTQLSDTRDVKLKQATSLDAPTFILTGNDFNWNYCQYGNRYYFITDIRSVHDNLSEVDCILDPLATAKDYILASVQYVCYSSHNSNTWLPDTRIPLVKATKTARNTAGMGGLFNDVGFYVLTAVGLDGCVAYALDKSTLDQILHSVQDWQDDGINAIVNDDMSLNYDFSSVENAIQSLGKMTIQTGFIGNAYALAPECIRSCIWVPFFATPFTDSGKDLYLGNLPCKDSGGSIIRPFTLKASPYKDNVSIAIPWHFNDWRRGICEDVYLYLPMVGMIQLSATSITNVSSINVAYSATATDGVVCYEIKAGGNVIGTYSGQCSANYPIGINQQASAGEIAQAIIGGVDKTVSAAINSSISPVSTGAVVAAGLWNGAQMSYDVANVQNSTHLTTVGGIGGGAGSGLDLNVQCYTVCHEPVMTPSDMQATMGLPTMMPMQMSTLTGYCQCANAHIDAPLMAQELDAVDAYLNSGFFIE